MINLLITVPCKEAVKENLIRAFSDSYEMIFAQGDPDVIARETGTHTYALDMAMGGDSYFAAMYHNINIIKEAMG